MAELQLAQPDIADAPGLIQFGNRIVEKSTDRGAATVVIAAFGDSVTQGVGPYDVFYHDAVYHARVKSALETRFPLCTFSVINAGVDGNTASDGEARLDRDVLRHQPDLTLVAFCLNDAAQGRGNLGRYRASLRSIVDRVRDGTPGDVLFVTPNMMLTRANDAIPEQWRPMTELLMRTQRGGVLGTFVDAMREVGSACGVPVADVYAAWQALAANGEDTTAMLSNGLNHPNPHGHALAARVIVSAIEGAVSRPAVE